MKHRHGTSGPHIEQVVEHDRRIGDIVQATRIGHLRADDFIIVGDHSQLDVRYKVYLNRLFLKKVSFTKTTGACIGALMYKVLEVPLTCMYNLRS